MTVQSTTELIDAPVAADVVENVQLIARTPTEMVAAQRSLSHWFAAKVAILDRDVKEAAENVRVAKQAKFKHKGFESALCRLRKRVDFYRKCQAAVEAGYCLVPNFPADCFAIRTERGTRDYEVHHRYSIDNEESEGPPLGAGEWADSMPTVGTRKRLERNKAGEESLVTKFFPKSLDMEIDFPVSVARPAVMSATAQAMALKCFDELHVLPSRSGKGDPVVIGVVLDRRSVGYNRRQLSFLIAWHVDTKEL